MGTSSGALVGSMFAAGYTTDEIAEEFSRVPPIHRLALSKTPWKGLLTLDPVAQTLNELLPPTFEQLSKEFAVGVVSTRGHRRHELINRGRLSEAVLASAAVPVLFSPVHIPGTKNGPYMDGGVACRIGLDLWRMHKQRAEVDEAALSSKSDKMTSVAAATPAIVHLIGRSSPWSGNDDTSPLREQNAFVVESPKSGASLWDLSGFDEQLDASYRRTLELLKELERPPMMVSSSSIRVGTSS